MTKNEPSEFAKNFVEKAGEAIRRHLLAKKIRKRIFHSGMNITVEQVEAVLKELENV